MADIMADIKERIRGFLGQYIRDEFTDDQDIFATGYVNSLFTMQLVVFVETEFEVVVEDDDLERANFCSVTALSGFLERKLAAPVGER